MYYKGSFILTILLISISCKTFAPIKTNELYPKKKSKLTIEEWRSWIHKDIEDDTIVGISSNKAYEKLLKNKKGDTVIVALLDNRIDSNHEDIKDMLWINKGEVLNNKIDDDQNGYIDDVHGWNFLGNANGENIDRANFEFTRIIRKYQDDFSTKTWNNIPENKKENFKLYIKAKKMYDESLRSVNKRLAYLDSIDQERVELYNNLKMIYNDTLLFPKSIDTLFSKDSIINIKLGKYKSHLEYFDWSFNNRQVQNRYLKVYLSLEYKERAVIGDDIDNINDNNYGNGSITAKKKSSHDHAIKVAGILAANRKNSIGIKGISNNLKIMPVCVSPSGDEQDKDIALGIRYAVDNDAKIIIMTFSKDIVQHNDWIKDAIKHASDNDVLIVQSAGNSSKNIDVEITYPNDNNDQNNEYVNNVIVVGGSASLLNEKLVVDFSNYGKHNVDIFAPAKTIYTTKRNQEYGYESGTSMSAPIVAGVAVLIRSHYPNLTASEVKQIIMESGVSYDIMVNKPSTSKEKELVPFSSLSKSGKIVNAYNALLLAEEVSKRRRNNFTSTSSVTHFSKVNCIFSIKTIPNIAKKIPLSWEMNMKKIVFIIISMALMSCTSFKQELQSKNAMIDFPKVLLLGRFLIGRFMVITISLTLHQMT